MHIPRIIHQTWKTADVPARWRAWQASWQHQHPQWEYRLWTDADNRALVQRHYPWFIREFDAYDAPIKRADAARYLIMHRYGGVYADLDFECLRPLGPLLAPHQLVLGAEPHEHADIRLVRASGQATIVGNAFIASVPGHPFWTHLFRALLFAAHEPSPLDATGPLLLTRAYFSYPAVDDTCLLDAPLVYPLSKRASWQRASASSAVQTPIPDAAWAVHHWDGSWWQRSTEPESDAGGSSEVHLMVAGRITRSTAILNATPAGAPNSDAGHGGDITLPMVSCLMVTRDRYDFARAAIACFRAQTYPRCELVIIDDDSDERLARYVACLADERIRHVRPAEEGLPLGVLRNLSVSHAKGTYVTQWDDDDLYDPQRLEAQMRALREVDADACMLLRQLHWWPGQRRMAVSRPRLWESSLLCERSRLPDYPAERRGEDTPVVAHVARHARVAMLDRPELYVYTCHERNTFDAAHFERHWKMAQEHFQGSHYDAMLVALGRRIPALGERCPDADAPTREAEG